MGQQHAIHKFVLGTKDFDDKQSEFMYDKGWYSITDIGGEERNIIYKSKSSRRAFSTSARGVSLSICIYR